MDPTSELIYKNIAAIAPAVLLINPPDDGILTALRAETDPGWFSQDFAVASRLAHPEDPGTHYGALPSPENLQGRQPILFLPKEKARFALLCKAIAQHSQAGQRLWLVGHNRSGIKSAGKTLKQYFKSPEKRDAARHCVLWQAEIPAGQDEPVEIAAELQWFEHPLADTTLHIAWLPGVFAKEGIDEASRLLLDSLPDRLQAGKSLEILDVGCGSGVLGAGAALLATADRVELERLVLCDSYAPAVEAARHTLDGNGLPGEVSASDVFSAISGRFDLILSNPPFHQGVEQNFSVPQRLIQQAPQYLKPGGRLIIVANRHLPYTGWMRKTFRQVNLLAETRSFLVIEGCEPQVQSKQAKFT